MVGCVFILLLAAFLRFHRLEGQSFWNDEGNSARLSERSIGLIIEGTASDIHPPLYYLMLRGWRELVGETEFGLRSLSAFAGVGLVAVVMALGWGLFGRGVGLVAGLVAAVNPALVYYSQEARMYALLGLWAGVGTWLLVRWLGIGGTQEGRVLSIVNGQWSIVNEEGSSSRMGRNTDGKMGRKGLAVAYVGVAVAGWYTHYFFPAVLLAHNLVVLVALVIGGRGEKSQILNPKSQMVSAVWQWVGMMVGVVVLYLPWLPVMVRQAGGREGVRGSLVAFGGESGRWLALGGMLEGWEAVWAMVGVVGLLVIGVLCIAYYVLSVRYRVSRIWHQVSRSQYAIRNMLSVWLLLVVPVGLMWVGGLVQEAFFKFMVVGVGPLALLLGWGAVELSIVDGQWSIVKWGRRLIGVLLLGLVVWGSGVALGNMYNDPVYARADYRGMAERIAAEGHPNAGVVLNAANQWEVFTYYHQEGAPVYPIPRGQPDGARIEAELREIVGRHDRLYAIFWGEAQRDPERLVERWLDAHAFKASEEWVGDVRFVRYAVPAEAATTMERVTDLSFGGLITLRGYTLQADEVAAGDILQLALFWEAERPVAERYKVFLHLVDENGGIVAQRDSEPGGGLALTTTWRPGEEVVDNHGVLVPLGTAAGEYRLLMGLYEVTEAGTRLGIETAEGVVDALEVGVVSVR